MKAGKVSQSILSRSVLKTIKYKTDDVVKSAKIGNDATEYQNVIMASSVAGLLLSEEQLWFDCRKAIANAMNNVASEGGYATGILVDVILPEKRLESELKELMRYISNVCKEYNLQITGGNTEVSRAVNRTIVSFTAFGQKTDASFGEKKCYAGMDIVMTKQIGLSGTVALAKEYKAMYEERFQKSYLQKALECESYMDVRKEANIAVEQGAYAMHDISRGGIYLALWQLSAKTNLGVEVLLDEIDVRQETIELCELLNLNPYKMMSDGALLIVCENGEALAETLESAGIPAKLIGHLRENQDKVILKNEEKRYIEPPKRDAIEEMRL